MATKPVFLRAGRGRGRGTQQPTVSNYGNTGRAPSVGNHGNTGSVPGRGLSSGDTKHTSHIKPENLSVSNNEDIVSDSDDSSFDENEAELILEKVLRNYRGNEPTVQADKASVMLANNFSSDSATCLICLEAIKRTNPIWTCDSCYCMLHLTCVQRWVTEGSHQKQNPALSTELFPNRQVPWACPKCRCEYPANACPKEYRCFCKKIRDPPSDPWILPHSCGEVCDKQLKPSCGHYCLLLCHPGPCPPCPVTVKTKCYCGAAPASQRRCHDKQWSCGSICSKRLACDKHKCKEICHAGPCKPCPEKSIQRCECGKNSSRRPCTEPNWSCDEICGNVFSCGAHTCQKICHKSSECGKLCPNSVNRTCPCGKVKLDIPCTERATSCGDTCDKLLACGLHRCLQRCHSGDCATCRETVEKSCRCGAKKKSVQCSKSFQCETKCPKVKDCGRHQCKKKCCTGDCPSCELVCGRSLGCGKHKCNSPCHTGRCYPCSVSFEIACPCGATKKRVPCGSEKNRALTPKCKQLCKQPPVCDHKSTIAHRCHAGDCPVCKLECGVVRVNCGHKCLAACHSAVLTKITEKVVRLGPWDPVGKVEYKRVRLQCPPCPDLVPVQCLGEHEVSQLPCHDSVSRSCGRKCGRVLLCTNHKCQLQCHDVGDCPDMNEGARLAGANCRPCEEECSLPRHPECTHPCRDICHPAPCKPCKQGIRKRCHCSALLMHIPCNEWVSLSPNERNVKLSCTGRCTKHLSCDHQCPEKCHAGVCPPSTVCRKKIKVSCKCGNLKIERRCDEHQKLGSSKASCDESCLQKLKEKEAQEQARIASEREAKGVKTEDVPQIRKRRRRRRSEQVDVEESKLDILYVRVRRVLPWLLSLVVFVLIVLFTKYALNLED